MNETETTVREQARQAAAYYGLAVAVLWILSFGLTMGGLTHPILSPLGFLTGILSIVRCGVLVRGFRAATPGVSLSMAYRLCWLTFLLAALLTTMAQYVYFRWIDGGVLAATYRTMLSTMQIAIPQADAEAVVDLIESLTPRQWAINMMLYNLILATVLAPVALLFARIKNKKQQ